MRLLRWTLWLLLALALTWVLLALSGWLPRLSQPQLDDLALLRQRDMAPAGQNAYPALLLQGFAVPVEQQGALLAEVIAARRQEPRWSSDQLHTLVTRTYLALPVLTIDLPCAAESPDCLLEVRARRAEVAGLIVTHARRLENWRAVQAHADHLWDPVPDALDSLSLVEWRHSRLPRIAAALAWVQQPGPDALSALCTHAAFWRRMRTGTNLLLADMVAVSELGHSARLLAAMLSEWPEDQSLPAACSGWISGLTDAELQHCAVARREFASLDRSLRTLTTAGATVDSDVSNSGWWWRITGGLFYQSEATLGLLASDFAAACRDPLAPRSPEQLREQTAVECGFVGQVFNPVGCVIAGIASPDQRSFHLRRLDLDAQLRALDISLRWRMHPEQRPQASGPVHGWAQQWHPLTLELETRQLRLGLQVPRGEPLWSLSLPWGPPTSPRTPTTSGTAAADPSGG